MFIVQRSFTRPDTSILFYKNTPEFNAHAKATYKDTGKLHTSSKTLSEDKLTQVISMLWESEEAWQEWLDDPVCQAHFNRRNAYYEQYGVTNDRTVAQL